MTQYFLVTVFMECLLLYTIYRSRNQLVTSCNRRWIYLLSIIGLVLIFANLGLEIPGIAIHRRIAGLTADVVLFGLLFIHQQNKEVAIMKDTYLTMLTFLLVGLFFVSFIFEIREMAGTV